MRFKAFCRILIVTGLGYSSSSTAQQAELPKAQINAAEILRRNIIATGGLEAHKALESLVVSGGFHLGTMHRMGDYIFSYKAPSSDVLQVQLISHGTTWTGHRGEQPFARATVEGAGMINGISMARVEQDWRSLLGWDFCCAYSRIELVGIAEVDKRSAYAVRFTPKHGDPFVCFYDRETFLLVRTDQIQRFRMNNREPEVAYAVVSYFRNYRTEREIKLPQVIAFPRNEGELVFDLTRVKQGTVIPDSIFQ
jgi:hypothetical protein